MGREGSGALRFAILVVAATLVALGGYLGYVAYPRFDLPPAVGLGLVGLAAAAGVASFFSPCSFPLLVTLLARSTDEAGSRGARVRRALVYASALSLGALAFVLAVGLLIGLGGRSIAASVTFTSATGRVLRGVVGGVLILLGLAQLGVVRLPWHLVERAAHPLSARQARLRREHPVAGFAVFGFVYLLAGFG